MPVSTAAGRKVMIDLFTGMETDARRANDVLERALFDHFYAVPPGQELTKRGGC